ncbi:DUF167 domain-containing protein [Desulfonatronum lacustre]|uniref:DUF167 domain-containing protein n=1 Tax=Desulfonatronum lacustre TaxID=66849 RepID=UPI0004BB3B01|nr:DUF167 domain-containing protein [Desulfonatronum lacustre]
MTKAVDRILRDDGQGWLLPVWVQPGAKRDQVSGIVDGRLKLRITAPAVDNKANTALAAYIAGQLGLRRNQVALVAGTTGRKKTLRIVAEQEPDWERLAPAGTEQHVRTTKE